MTRQELVLAALSPAQGALHTPVQVQKLLFLIETNLVNLVDDGPHFHFEPYHYGPFDRAVYDELLRLSSQGYVDIMQDRWNSYRLTVEGQRQGERLLSTLDEQARDYITTISSFVRSLTFTQLVAAIYRAYPAMRERSVFQG